MSTDYRERSRRAALRRFSVAIVGALVALAVSRYVRHVVDVFGPNRHLVAMTITNEINLAVSPNTSDGAYPHAEEALVQGIIAAHQEAERRGFRQLRFGFTFAYRIPSATVQMLGTMRRCFMRLGGLGAGIPIWITESGYDTAPDGVTDAQQRTRC
jgi:hypothetical protein